MEPEEQRRRAGETVAERMRELGLTPPELAAKASVDPTTVRALMQGTRRLRESTWERILTALNMPAGDVSKRLWALEDISTEELAAELCRRFNHDRHVR